MGNGFFDVSFDELPTILPVLPFKDVFLFPSAKLQLRLYEKRYVSLGLNALSHGRLLALLQPKAPVPNGLTDDLYATGCVGRISAFSENDDDSLFVTLTGVCRFKAVREIPDFKGYRRIEADYSAFKEDLAPPPVSFDVSVLQRALDLYAYSNKIDISSGAFKHLPVADMMSSIVQTLPFSAAEKQAFLESVTVKDRLATLLMLLNMEQNVDGGIKKAGSC